MLRDSFYSNIKQTNRRYDDLNAQYRLNCVHPICWHSASSVTSSPHKHINIMLLLFFLLFLYISFDSLLLHLLRSYPNINIQCGTQWALVSFEFSVQGSSAHSYTASVNTASTLCKGICRDGFQGVQPMIARSAVSFATIMLFCINLG